MTKKEMFADYYYEDEGIIGYDFKNVFIAEKDLENGEISYIYNDDILVSLNEEIVEDKFEFHEDDLINDIKKYFKEFVKSYKMSFNQKVEIIKSKIFFKEIGNSTWKVEESIQQEFKKYLSDLYPNMYDLYKKYWNFDLESIEYEVKEVYDDMLRFIDIEKKEMKDSDKPQQELTEIEEGILNKRKFVFEGYANKENENIQNTIKNCYEDGGEEILDEIIEKSTWEFDIQNASKLDEHELITLDNLLQYIPEKVISIFLEEFNPIYDNSNLEIIEKIIALCQKICCKENGEPYNTQEILEYLEQVYLTYKFNEKSEDIDEYIENKYIDSQWPDDINIGGRK